VDRPASRKRVHPKRVSTSNHSDSKGRVMQNESWEKTFLSENYEVSNLGNVRSLPRKIYRSENVLLKTIKGQMLSPFISSSTGYLQVRIGKKVNLHRLVAFAFCGGYFDGAVVNHKNGIRSDCRAENLEWVTISQNCKHAYSDLNRRPTSLGKFSKDHPTSKPVISCSKTFNDLKFWYCGLDAVKSMGASSEGISRASNEKISSHLGLLWFTPERYFDAVKHQYVGGAQ
jgi:hypothetical protein